MQLIFTIWKVPPFEKKGRGIPVIGMIPNVIPIFSNMWINNRAKTPIVIVESNILVDFLEILSILDSRSRNSDMAIMPPKNPNSSDNTGKIKSVCCSGKYLF